MGILKLSLFVLSILLPATANSGEVYVSAYIEPNMASRADGGNPHSGIGIYQPITLFRNLVLSGRVEALFQGVNRDQSSHDISIRYTIKLRYDYAPLFFEAERFAWNPISHSPLPAGMKDQIGGGDTMSAFSLRMGWRY